MYDGGVRQGQNRNFTGRGPWTGEVGEGGKRWEEGVAEETGDWEEVESFAGL